MKRIMLLVTVAAMMAAMLALSGAALAQGDVCVSIKGETPVDKGDSECFSDTTSQAVAVNDSDALAINDSNAVAVNKAWAIGLQDCTVTAQNGDIDVCVFF
jgi:type 1 fimbria pilin